MASAHAGRDKSFVDFQNDVTAADIALATREGYTSVEHLKRYTTLGMGTDQGKLSNINGLAILSQLLNANVPRSARRRSVRPTRRSRSVQLPARSAARTSTR
jgi:sarcosine oxidase subunit alpha